MTGRAMTGRAMTARSTPGPADSPPARQRAESLLSTGGARRVGWSGAARAAGGPGIHRHPLLYAQRRSAVSPGNPQTCPQAALTGRLAPAYPRRHGSPGWRAAVTPGEGGERLAGEPRQCLAKWRLVFTGAWSIRAWFTAVPGGTAPSASFHDPGHLMLPFRSSCPGSRKSARAMPGVCDRFVGNQGHCKPGCSHTGGNSQPVGRWPGSTGSVMSRRPG